MKSFLPLLLTQVPFLVYLWLVPPERRALGQRLGAALTASLSLGALGLGIWQLSRGTAAGRVWIGLGLVGLALAAARARGWIGPRDGQRY